MPKILSEESSIFATLFVLAAEHRLIFSWVLFLFPSRWFLDSFLINQINFQSILAFTKGNVNFRIATDNKTAVENYINSSIPKLNHISFDIRKDNTASEMAFLRETLKFKGCGHLKVVFHQTFPELKRILLLDADTIILKPVEELFDLFDDFSNETVIGMAQEHPHKENGKGFRKKNLLVDFIKRVKSINRYYSHRPYAHNKYGLNGGLHIWDFERLNKYNFKSPYDPQPIVSQTYLSKSNSQKNAELQSRNKLRIKNQNLSFVTRSFAFCLFIFCRILTKTLSTTQLLVISSGENISWQTSARWMLFFARIKASSVFFPATGTCEHGDWMLVRQMMSIVSVPLWSKMEDVRFYTGKEALSEVGRI